MERTQPISATTYYLRAIRTFMQFDSYRPELYYMRGPGPKWHAKRNLAFAAIARSRNDSECCVANRRLIGSTLGNCR